MPNSGPVQRIFESSIFLTVGAIADASTVALLLANESFRNWLAHHIIVAVVATALLFATTVGLLNRTLRLSTENRHLQSELTQQHGVEQSLKKAALELEEQVTETQARNKEQAARIQELEVNLLRPTAQDIYRFGEFARDFGPDSRLHKWLHDSFYGAHARSGDLRMLDAIYEKWDRDPTTYHDKELADLFTELKTGIYALIEATRTYYWTVGDNSIADDDTILQIPSEWKNSPEKYDRAMDAILGVWDKITDAYNAFIRAAHAKMLG